MIDGRIVKTGGATWRSDRTRGLRQDCVRRPAVVPESAPVVAVATSTRGLYDRFRARPSPSPRASARRARRFSSNATKRAREVPGRFWRVDFDSSSRMPRNRSQRRGVSDRKSRFVNRRLRPGDRGPRMHPNSSLGLSEQPDAGTKFGSLARAFARMALSSTFPADQPATSR